MHSSCARESLISPLNLQHVRHSSELVLSPVQSACNGFGVAQHKWCTEIRQRIVAAKMRGALGALVSVISFILLVNDDKFDVGDKLTSCSEILSKFQLVHPLVLLLPWVLAFSNHSHEHQ